MKTKDEPKKQTGNKAETKLAKLLKTIETPKKQTENKPENKAGHLLENKRQAKSKPKTNRKNPVMKSFPAKGHPGAHSRSRNIAFNLAYSRKHVPRPVGELPSHAAGVNPRRPVDTRRAIGHS